MKRTHKASITWLVVALLVAGSALARKQAPQQSGNQSQSDSSTAKNSTKNADASSSQTPDSNAAGTVWVNTDSGIYHKPGSRWYGKTKRGKYMTEADAVKAGYREAKKKE